MAHSSGNSVRAVRIIKASETKPEPTDGASETDADYIRRMLTLFSNTWPLYQLDDNTFVCITKAFDPESGKFNLVMRPISREYFKNYTQTKPALPPAAVSNDM